MVFRAAEDAFRRGLAALEREHVREALAHFEAAIRIETRARGTSPQPRYLSFYGLALALERSNPHLGLPYCREAFRQEFFNPDLCCNLGRLLLWVGRRREAYEILRQGLILQPNHPGLQDALARMGRRRRPVLRFLQRSHPLNVILGRWRHARRAGRATPSGAQDRLHRP